MMQEPFDDDGNVSWIGFVAFLTAMAVILFFILLLAAACDAAEPIERFGAPEGTVIHQGKFEFAFDGRTREPRWVLEYLDWDTINVGRAVRNESFTSDERIPRAFRVSDADYQTGGYDRGHLAPADDFGRIADHAATFLFSNCVPQNPHLNRGLWAGLEKRIRESVGRDDRCWVLTVPLFEPRNNHVGYDVIGPHGLAVPTHVAKAVIVLHGKQREPTELPGWKIPNKLPRDGATPDDYRLPLEDLERDSGLELWPALDAELKHKLATKKLATD